MTVHFGDQLAKAVKAKRTPACVGIDPVFSKLPEEVMGDLAGMEQVPASAAAHALYDFSSRIIRKVAAHVPIVKINSAFFEHYLWDGVKAYYQLVHEAKELGLMVIGDIKRADIGTSSTPYAQGHLANPKFTDTEGSVAPDAVTVNPYFSIDGVKPFLDVCSAEGKGIFVLVQTSNPSSHEVQGLELTKGGTVCETVGGIVNTWAQDLRGEKGFSSVGAVVSPHGREATERLRSLMPNCWFLVPGFGAQGRTADDVAPCFNEDGMGALINASRSVNYAFASEKYTSAFGDNWEKCVEQACKDFVEDLKSVAKL